MQKQFLAAVVASVVAGQAMAVTVIDDGTNKFTIGGHVGMRYEHDQNRADNKLQAAGDSSRFNFQFESKLSEDVTAFARTEWGFDVTNHDNFGFTNRLGFAGVKGNFGSISVGQQWSTFSQIANWTDTFATASAAEGSYTTNAGYLGSSRANDTIQYNLNVDALNISAQYQTGAGEAKDGRTRKHGYSFAASYDLPMGVSLGATYNQVQFVENDKNDAKAMLLAAKFEQGPIYSAFTYGEYKNYVTINTLTENARGIEFVGGYQLAENLSVQTGFVQMKDKDSSDKTQHVPVEVVYTAGPVQLSGTYNFVQSQHEDAVEGKVETKDSFVAQVRYYF